MLFLVPHLHTELFLFVLKSQRVDNEIHRSRGSNQESASNQFTGLLRFSRSSNLETQSNT